MLLVMHNLPSDAKYSDIKALIQSKCFVSEVILDKLVKEGPTNKKVTIGVAKEEDAMRIKNTLNGTYFGGLQVFIEDIKKSQSKNNSDMSMGSDYQGNNNQNQVAGYQQSSLNPSMTQQMGMYQYGYGTPANQMGYQTQQGMNQQGMSQQMMSYGYGAWMTSNNSGIAPLRQNNLMGYGNQQVQLQSNTSSGQFGGSGPSSKGMGPQKELGFGYPSGPSQNDREGGRSNGRGFSTQTSYTGNQNDRGSQSSWRDSQQDRGRGSQSWSTLDNRGRGSQQSSTRDYGSGNFNKDTRFGSGNTQDSRGFGSQKPYNQMAFDLNDSWGNSSRGSSGFDQSRGRDASGDRKRRHSPEPVPISYRGNSSNGFQGGSFKSEGNQGRGFDSNRDSRDSRAGLARDSYSNTPTPLLQKSSGPYSWSNNSNTSSRFNDKPRHFGGDQSSFEDKPRLIGDQSRSFDSKPGSYGGSNFNKDRNDARNDSKSRVVWNSKYQPPRAQNSPAEVPPEKRPKREEKPPVNTVVFDQKTTNRAISWRGEGVSMLAKEIFKRQSPNHPLTKKQAGLKMLKKALNTRIEEIIKQKYPDNPYPLLQGPEIAKLYRETYPVWTDEKLSASCAGDAPVTGSADKKPESKPNIPPPSTLKPMGMPSATNAPQPRPPPREVKPFPKPSFKPRLSDLLPPQLLQHPPRPKLMLGPNAHKKKPKPYNVEKRARAEQRQLSKREFLEENLYKCPTPAMEKALNAVLDEITDVFNTAVDEHPTQIKEEKLIGETIKQKAAPEFRSMVRLHTIKRILKVTKTLTLRIFVSPGKASKENVEQALKPYGLLNLKSSTQSKTPMFTAGVKSYHNYDRLCTTTGIPVAGRNGPSMITAKPLHLTMPFKLRRLLRQKLYAELTGDHDENDDFGKGVKDDDDDDYDEEEQGDDDDIIDVTKENDVIELSGDEKLNVSGEIKDEKAEVKTEGAENSGENGANKSVSNEKTVDLTMDDNVDLTVDEKMNAAIAEEMGDSVVEIDEEEIREDDLEDY